MFEDLDDPSEPTPAPLDDVAARGRVLRFRRRSAIAGIAALTLLGAVSTVALTQGSASTKKVTVAADDTTIASTNPTGPTTPDASTPTTDTTPTSADTTPATVATPGPTTPPVTQAPHDPHDYSQLSYSYPGDALHVTTGATTTLTYTVTNNGPWDVQWDVASCGTYHVWGNQAYTWPNFTEVHGFDNGCGTTAQTLAAGASAQQNVTIAGGYQQGDVFVPARPGGGDFFWPPTVPQMPGVCTNPCFNIYVDNASPALFAVNLPATVTVKSGSHAGASFTIVNNIGTPITVDLIGPCVNGSPCTARSPLGSDPSTSTFATLTVPAHTTKNFTADVWATSNLTSSGTPLSPGDYDFTWGDETVAMHVTN